MSYLRGVPPPPPEPLPPPTPAQNVLLYGGMVFVLYALWKWL